MHGEHGLIDFDLWTYDIPFAAQRKDKDTGEIDVLPFKYCIELFDKRIEEIKTMAGITTWEGFLTGDGNFRHAIAKNLPYKGNRHSDKPFHYENMRTWLEHKHGVKVINGMEADDMLAIRQIELGEQSCIVTRDKDLRMVPGWHFGYSVGAQKTFGPHLFDELGSLWLDGRGDKSKLIGGGLKFFYAQCIMGDRTDNIQGLPRGGDVLAYRTLNECRTEEEMFQKVWNLFADYYGEEAGSSRLLEDGQLLWMTRHLDENNNPILWQFPMEPVRFVESTESNDDS